MSKYIKLEDAIEQVKTEFYGGGYQEWLEISIDNLINRIANLPTIEVSEDCISRSALISFIDAGHLRNPNEKCYSENDVVELIRNAPSVTTEQSSLVGEWILSKVDCTCSKCGAVYRWIAKMDKANFCPNCGAKMKGQKKDFCGDFKETPNCSECEHYEDHHTSLACATCPVITKVWGERKDNE